MSTAAAPVVAAPAPAKNAIQIIEEQIANFFKQRESAVANVHSVDGAIQGAQHLLQILKAEAGKAEAEAKKLIGEAKTEAIHIVDEVEAEGTHVVAAVEGEITKL